SRLSAVEMNPQRGNVMAKRIIGALGVVLAVVLGFVAGRVEVRGAVAAESGLTALDYEQITQLIHRYAYGIDTCGGNGYDYANVFTTDGVFIDKNSDAGYAAGGRVLAKGRDALAELIGGGPKRPHTPPVADDWQPSGAEHG